IEEHVSINDAGTVAFSGGGLSSSDLVGLFTGSGGAVTPIADDSGPLVFPFFASINDVGTVAFLAQLDGGGNGLFLGGTQVRPFADTNGLFSFFFGRAPSINDTGQVAFGAGLDGGGTGIFVGPNPLADKVITTGDSLFGSTVTSLSLGSQALNNAGRVAFYAELSDGTQGVFVATPVPEPSTLLLSAVALAGLAAGRGWHDSGFRRGRRLGQ
ncbi:MAG TPA: choice-of-anchor tandem repeat NxxGxxAF-containing protein, partial [Burkholderiales bacterium]|nr:choice-of-anchor tandem repeat NxxGxxAF-containing protein [Burkholderiales bacterium]